jgi:uncharacterized protein (TIGR03083 family)
VDPIAALDASAARVVQLVDQVDRSQWSDATPCADWDVRELVGHLIATMRGHVELLHGGPASDLSALLEQQAVAGGDDLLTAVTDAGTAAVPRSPSRGPWSARCTTSSATCPAAAYWRCA